MENNVGKKILEVRTRRNLTQEEFNAKKKQLLNL